MGSLPPSEPIRVAVIECDTPPDRVAENYGDYGNLFRELLEHGAQMVEKQDSVEKIELDVTKFDVVNHEFYPKFENIDAVLLTGSKYDSFDNAPWILKLVEFTKEAMAHDHIKVIGVCFGHQIVGRALGAPVGRNEKGWEMSVVRQELTPKGKHIFGGESLSLHQMHRDIVYSYPDNVQKLAYTERCEVQSMYIPNKMISVQGHPEFNGEIVTDITQRRHDQGIFDKALYDDAMSRVNDYHHGAIVGAAFVRFLLTG